MFENTEKINFHKKLLYFKIFSAMAYGATIQFLFCTFTISSFSSTVSSYIMEYLYFL